MKIKDIEEQRNSAQEKEKDAESKYNEARSSAESVIKRTEQLVHENESALASATGHREAAENKVGQLKNSFEAASRGLDKKIREMNEKRATIACCDNALNIYWSRKIHVEMEIGQLKSRAFGCRDEKKRTELERSIADREALIAQYDAKIVAYDKLKLKTQAEMPRIEHAVKVYSETMNKVKAQLESAEEALKGAIEEEKKAKDALDKARELKEKNTAEANQKLREAAEAHENARKLLEYWNNYLNAALNQLNNYAYGVD